MTRHMNYWYNWSSKSIEDTFVYMEDDIYITNILNIFIIVIIFCPILNCMIHYNVCNDKGKYWTILWAIGSGNPNSPPGYWL